VAQVVPEKQIITVKRVSNDRFVQFIKRLQQACVLTGR